MFEINITRFATESCMRDYSASAAELGQSAGADTWRAACDDAPDYALDMLPDENAREEFRQYIRGFGAWDETEIRAMDEVELGALLLQMIAGALRECGIDRGPIDWEDVRQRAEAGQISGRTYPGANGQIYYSIGE